ncbi:MAG: lipocalin-like domain-containing protein [Pseudomonadota bacterium]
MNVVGVWKLLSLQIEDAASGALVQPWGDAPSGCLTYTENGHVTAVLSASGRQALCGAPERAIEDRAQLYKTFHAYAGTYSIDAGVLTHRVQVSSDPAWVGSEQIRLAHLDDGILTLSTPPLQSPDGMTYKNTLSWTRAE